MANIRKTKESFDIEISKKYNEDLESLDFITTKHPVTIRCKTCDYTKHFTKAANFLYCSKADRKGFCPNCRDNIPFNKWQHKDFVAEVAKRHPNADQFEFLSTYINRDNPIEVKCLKCGQTFSRTARAFLLGRDCPLCSYKKSMGENKIQKILTDMKLTFDRNFILSDFDHRKSFDFKVYLSDSSYFLIEFDGIQHFEYNEFLHGGDYENFKIQQEHDRLKNEYCSSHNIPLLRIKYDTADIKTTIKKFIETLV